MNPLFRPQLRDSACSTMTAMIISALLGACAASAGETGDAGTSATGGDSGSSRDAATVTTGSDAGTGPSDAGGSAPDAGPTYTSVPIATPPTHKTAAADTCTSWQVVGAPMRLTTCSYPSGGSGYSVVENTGAVPADICFLITFNTAGKPPTKGCHLGLEPGAVPGSACASCGANNGGAKLMELTKFTPK